MPGTTDFQITTLDPKQPEWSYRANITEGDSIEVKVNGQRKLFVKVGVGFRFETAVAISGTVFEV